MLRIRMWGFFCRTAKWIVFFAIAPYLIPMALPAKAALQQLKYEFILSSFGKTSLSGTPCIITKIKI